MEICRVNRIAWSYNFKRTFFWSSLAAQWVKDLALSLLWLKSLLWYRFNPWSRKFCMPWAWPKKAIFTAVLRIYLWFHIRLLCVCVCGEKAACMKFADRCLLHVKTIILITVKALCQSEMPHWPLLHEVKIQSLIV